jgi:DNA-binding SARP family transcriptional activator
MLSVHLFGQLEIYRDGSAVAGLDARKAQELFAYLLLDRERSHPRETLAGLLWSDPSSEQSKAYLRKVLWQLQSALAGPGSRAEKLVQAQGDTIRVDASQALWLDVSEFEAAYSGVRGKAAAELTDEQVAALQAAVDLYRGDLLEGWYLDWCSFHRERLLHMHLTMLDKLMAWCEIRGQYEAGLDYGDRILRQDCAHELTHRRLMRLHFSAGDRTAALRQYERCVVTLERELGVAPDKRTTARYEAIRNQETTELDGAPLPPAVQVSDPSGHISEITRTLKSLQRLLLSTQREVDESIHRIEDSLQ